MRLAGDESRPPSGRADDDFVAPAAGVVERRAVTVHRARPWPLFLLGLGACCGPCEGAPARRPGPHQTAVAARVIRRARIYIGDEAGRFASAMATRGEEILYVGDESGVRPYLDAHTEVHDLGGRLVLPGLHDVHQHTLEAHLAVVDCALDPRSASVDAYLRAISGCYPARGTSWVLGWGYNIQTLLAAGREPRLLLDAVIADRPVAIMEETSHSTWVNTLALATLGITASSPDPQGGIIVRGRGGRPNGLLLDAAGEYPWEAALAPNDVLRAENLAALREAMQHNAAYGITSAVDARTYVQRGYLDAYRALERSGELTTRMVLSLWASPLAGDDAQIALLRSLFRDDGGRLRVRQVKFYSDGLLQNTTAALLEPYTTRERLGPEAGLNYFPQARLARYLRELQPAGFDGHIHAIGDRAVREALSAVAEARSAANGEATRHRLTHVELTHPDDVARFASSGVAADMQLGSHTDPANVAETAEFVGPQRAEREAWVLRDLWNTGAVVALSSDFDVGELNPFATIARALRRGLQSLPDVAAALRAYTMHPAYIMRSERRTGSLEVGKLADFIVVDRDVFRVAPEEIAGTRVLWTVVGGDEVFRREGFRP